MSNKKKTWERVEKIDPENHLGLDYHRDTEKEILERIFLWEKENLGEQQASDEEKEEQDAGDSEDTEIPELSGEKESEEAVEEASSLCPICDPDTDIEGECDCVPLAEEVSNDEEEETNAEEKEKEKDSGEEQVPPKIDDEISYIIHECEHCGEKFDDSAGLVVHIEEIHMCHTKGCGFYGTVEELKIHIEDEAIQEDEEEIDEEMPVRRLNRFRRKK